MTIHKLFIKYVRLITLTKTYSYMLLITSISKDYCFCNNSCSHTSVLPHCVKDQYIGSKIRISRLPQSALIALGPKHESIYTSRGGASLGIGGLSPPPNKIEFSKQIMLDTAHAAAIRTRRSLLNAMAAALPLKGRGAQAAAHTATPRPLRSQLLGGRGTQAAAHTATQRPRHSGRGADSYSEAAAHTATRRPRHSGRGAHCYSKAAALRPRRRQLIGGRGAHSYSEAAALRPRRTQLLGGRGTQAAAHTDFRRPRRSGRAKGHVTLITNRGDILHSLFSKL